MGAHATDPGVFIRSMATRGQLGGLAAAAPQAVRVLDAAGTPWIVVETVGVGQVELDVAGATDTTVVVVTPGWGDGVQANKAGLLEVADVFVVNKADRAGRRRSRCATSSPCSSSRRAGIVDAADRRDASPPPATASTGCGTPSSRTASTWSAPAMLDVRRRDRLHDEVRRDGAGAAAARGRRVPRERGFDGAGGVARAAARSIRARSPGRVVAEELGIADEP